MSKTFVDASDNAIFIEQPAAGLKLYATRAGLGVELRVQMKGVHLIINLGEYATAALADCFAPNLRVELMAATARAEAAEAKLALAGDYATYYVIAWEAFERDSDGPEPLDFAEWLAQQSEVQP